MLGLGCLLVGYVMARYLGRVSPAEDYLWRAPTWVERGGAWWALLGACLVAMALVIIHVPDPKWQCRGLPLFGLMVTALGIGAVGGIAARPVNGANIGGGIALFLGLPLLVVMAIALGATVVRPRAEDAAIEAVPEH